MAEDTHTLDGLLRAHGADELADALVEVRPIAAGFDRHRRALSDALTSATAEGGRDAIRNAIHAEILAGGPRGQVLQALLQDDRNRLPAFAPPPTPSPAHDARGVPSPPPTPAEMAYTARRATPIEAPSGPPAASRAGDEFVWSVVGLAVIGVLVAVAAPTTTLIVLAPLLFVGQLLLLGLDRRTLGRTGLRGPAWGWVVFAPGYCYRRARALGQAPHYAYALVAIGVAGRLAVSTFGLGGGPLIDTEALAATLNEAVEQTWEVDATTDCPRWVEVTVGDEFTCTATMAHGAQYAVTYKIMDERGRLREADTSLRNLP